MDKAAFETARKSDSPLAAWEVVKQAGLSLGFSVVWGYRLSLTGISQPTIKMAGGDTSWPSHFINRDYGPIDPVRAIYVDQPFSFDLDDLRRHALTQQQQKILNEMSAFGITDALFAHARTQPDCLDVIMFGCGGGNIPPKGDDRRERLVALATLVLVKEAKFHEDDTTAIDDLTPKELEILQLLPVASSNKDLAYRAGIQPSTLDTHLSNIRRKTGITKKVDLIMLALGTGH